jgi:ABC-type transporter Mla maintaining outer membrane lipid asymmetry permease subunit MlaE
MGSVEIALLTLIVLVVGIGGGWFVYDANRSDEE